VAETFPIIAKTLFGLEEVLADELRELGAEDVQVGRRLCSFRGDQRMLYRVNVCCRTATRVLKPILRFPADGADALYRRIGRTNWIRHLDPEGTLAIDPVTSGNIFTNSLYAAQVAKDAIVDQIRRATGKRPSIELDDPDLRINLHIDGKRVTVYLDASGESLHKRGYRLATGAAPLGEVLAAGILRLAEWDATSPLVDFMCGSGTIPIEAAMLARRIAPGTRGRTFGFQKWQDYDAALDEDVRSESRRQERANLSFPIVGSDRDGEMIAAARANAERAGVAADIQWQVTDFAELERPAPAGTLITNPPYEERIRTEEIVEFHKRIGDVLKHRWAGYTAWVLAGNLDAAKFIGLKPNRKIRLFNGQIECRLLKFAIYAFGERPRAKAAKAELPED
jgi:putative N6-adenine-specific DNA methylase